MKRYRIFDTLTLEVIYETTEYRDARKMQAIFNESKCAVHVGNGYVVRFALQDCKFPRSNKGSSGLPEPAMGVQS